MLTVIIIGVVVVGVANTNSTTSTSTTSDSIITTTSTTMTTRTTTEAYSPVGKGQIEFKLDIFSIYDVVNIGGLLITVGYGRNARSAELVDVWNNRSCQLPDLPEGEQRYSHTQV